MDTRASAEGRLAEIRRLTEEMDHAATLSDGHFNAIGMLVTDASLACDAPTLESAQDGLQWVCRRYAPPDSASVDIEHRGRLLGLIDVTHWALRRLPSGLQLSLDPDGYAARFLFAVAGRPGLSNQQLADELEVDETEVSRVGRRLLAAGVVWRRREWRRNVWDVTPRGRQYLDNSGLRDRLVGTPAGAPPRALSAGITLTYAVGVKILPEVLVGVVTDRDAAVLTERQHRISGPLTAQEALSELSSFVRDLLSAVPEITDRGLSDVGVGVEIGAHVAAEAGQVVYAPNYEPRGCWTGFPLGRHLETELGLPVVVENDANALAEFEHALGAGVDAGCSATLLLDQGVGCGIVMDGRLVRGAGGSAGEIGHVVVEPAGAECLCGNRGCLDTVVGTHAIAESIARSDRKVPDLAAAADLAAGGDPEAIQTLQRAGDALGLGVRALLNLINPRRIVLYGPPELVSEEQFPAAEHFMTGVRRSGMTSSFSNSGRECSLVRRTYTPAVGARAAAAVALLRLAPRSR